MERAPARVVWRHASALARPVRRRYLGAAAAVILSTLITLAGPALVRYAVDAGIKKHDYRPLDVAAIVFLGLAAVKPAVVRAQILLAASAGERFLGALRTAAFDKLQSLPLGFFEHSGPLAPEEPERQRLAIVERSRPQCAEKALPC